MQPLLVVLKSAISAFYDGCFIAYLETAFGTINFFFRVSIYYTYKKIYIK